MRTFIAIELNDGQKNKLTELQAELKKCRADLKIVETQNLHLTLRFLGEINENELEQVKSGLEKACAGIGSFQMGLKGAGVFPDLNYIRVIWAGVEKGKTELEKLASSINKEVLVGKKDERGFSAHITIARVESAREKEEILGVLKKFENFDFGETVVDAVKIKESKLEPTGPKYEDLGVFRLAKIY